ncbi:helix-turn-helix domain-containing protein [Flagellimonas sp.]|uniref:helix-turn-helix domain-containing protein n=1 Tax=Flagellimonas sp. TaxID=2058762 RepID=UPI003F4A5B05
MEINYNIISTIHIFGFLQGLILGLLLLRISRKKNRSTFFLALFVLTYAYCFVPIILEDINILNYYPRLQVLPRPGEWLLAALFFMYIQKISILRNEKIKYWWLYPGGVILLAQIVVFFLPPSTKLEISNAIWYRPVFLLGHLYSTAILIYGIQLLRKHTREVENQYSNVESKNLVWVRRFLLFAVFLFAMHFIAFFTYESTTVRVIYAGMNVFMLYWASIHGVIQQNILPATSKQHSDSKLNPNTKVNTEVPLLSFNEMQNIVNKVEHYIKESEAFVDRHLTIANVSEVLKVHPKRISMSINKVCQENFNAYINKYRIEKAEKLLMDKNKGNLSIEGIGYEVGFQSKSTFYTAFKRITGTTPNRYKERLAS